MKNKYSIFSLIKNAFSYHENWQKAWKDPQPKKEYDAVIVGGGGHGLATAYYLAKKHNMKNIAVVEKGWIGGGNTGRNTTIIRSNYLWDASAGLYDHALKLWEGLSQEINYNVMFSQRGVMNLAHNLQDIRDLKRRTHANRLNGIDAVYLSTEEVKKFCPIINTSPDIPAGFTRRATGALSLRPRGRHKRNSSPPRAPPGAPGTPTPCRRQRNATTARRRCAPPHARVRA